MLGIRPTKSNTFVKKTTRKTTSNEHVEYNQHRTSSKRKL